MVEVSLLERSGRDRVGDRGRTARVLRRTGRCRYGRALRRLRRRRTRDPVRSSASARFTSGVAARRRREVLHRSRRDDADRCGACRVRRRAGPCARPRGRGGLREQGDEQCARQSRRSDVQRVRAALREADALLRRHAPEPSELPRSRLGIDPRDHLRLHDLHRRGLEPRRHARGGRKDLEDIRRGTSLSGLPRRLVPALCEEAQPVRVLPGHRRESEQAGEDRPAATARHGSSSRRPARLLARRPGSLPLDARLLGRGRRRLAPPNGRPSVAVAEDRNPGPVRRRKHCVARRRPHACPRRRHRRTSGLGFHGRSRITTAHCARSSRPSVFPRSAGRPERDRSRASGVSAACRESRGGLEFHQADADRTRRSARRA